MFVLNTFLFNVQDFNKKGTKSNHYTFVHIFASLYKNDMPWWRGSEDTASTSGTEDPGSNPAREGYRVIIAKLLFTYNNLPNLNCLCAEKRNKGIATPPPTPKKRTNQ
jgi:hypothetical protein